MMRAVHWVFLAAGVAGIVYFLWMAGGPILLVIVPLVVALLIRATVVHRRH